MSEAAQVWTTVASHVRYFPPIQGMRVAPSGRLPSDRKRPAGSLVLGTSALSRARQIMSLIASPETYQRTENDQKPSYTQSRDGPLAQPNRRTGTYGRHTRPNQGGGKPPPGLPHCRGPGHTQQPEAPSSSPPNTGRLSRRVWPGPPTQQRQDLFRPYPSQLRGGPRRSV